MGTIYIKTIKLSIADDSKAAIRTLTAPNLDNQLNQFVVSFLVVSWQITSKEDFSVEAIQMLKRDERRHQVPHRRRNNAATAERNGRNPDLPLASIPPYLFSLSLSARADHI